MVAVATAAIITTSWGGKLLSRDDKAGLAVGVFVGTEIAVKVDRTVDVKVGRGVELITTDVMTWVEH